jgi:hypothetical protein
MSRAGPERKAAAPVVIWTMPSACAAAKPRRTPFSVSDDVTLTAASACPS